MSIETLVLLGVGYAVGCYITAFLIGMMYVWYGIVNGATDWFTCIFWPIALLIAIMVWLGMLCQFSFSKMRNRFPATVRSVQMVLKHARTVIFAVSLVFHPTKLGEIVGKRIFRDRARKTQQGENK